jgi:hypothetical protein
MEPVQSIGEKIFTIVYSDCGHADDPLQTPKQRVQAMVHHHRVQTTMQLKSVRPEALREARAGKERVQRSVRRPGSGVASGSPHGRDFSRSGRSLFSSAT